MESLRRAAEQVDDLVYRLERLLLLVCLTLMTGLVTLDVVQRAFSRPVGKLDALLLALLYDAPTEAQQAFVVGTLGPAVFALLALALLTLAAHSSREVAAERSRGPKPGVARSLALGVALLGGLWLFVKALLWVFPSSVPGAQKFALGLMLWAGLLGASLATKTRRHIILDPIKKKLDPGTLRQFSLVGGLVTGAFCGLIALLGVMQLHTQYVEWAQGDGVGVYDALPIPLWVGTLSIPLSFAMMGLRFAGQGIHDFKWGPPSGGADAHGIDLEALEKEQLPLDGGAA
jgi:C4-dicarboxylate transporter DctQ subunit